MTRHKPTRGTLAMISKLRRVFGLTVDFWESRRASAVAIGKSSKILNALGPEVYFT
jgi:hypothetical protein